MNTLLHEDETLDDLGRSGLKIIQKQGGYRFSLDPVLLVDFALIREGDVVADLGTGGGVVPLLVTIMAETERLVGIEIQDELASRAKRSVQVNNLQDRVEIVSGDIRCLKGKFPQNTFDVVLANPPYRKIGSGRTAPEEERAAARHEMAGGIREFLGPAAYLLREGGRFFLVHLPDRTAEILCEMRHSGLEAKRIRFVHGRCKERARIVLFECRKGGREGLVVEPPLFVYDRDGYTDEVEEIYRKKHHR